MNPHSAQVVTTQPYSPWLGSGLEPKEGTEAGGPGTIRLMGIDPVHAVLAPSEVPLFRQLTGIGDAPLDVDFEGWAKLALLSDDRVFLFPRRGREAGLARGALALEALGAAGVECVPKVVGRWGDDLLASGPFVALERRPGRHWEALEDAASLSDVETMLRSLGATIASWQSLDVANLPGALQSASTGIIQRTPGLVAMLTGPSGEGVVAELAKLVAAPATWEGVWTEAVAGVAAMRPVLIHGDVCENQLLVDHELTITSVLDWDTAGLGHPLYDFDFGEWGTGIFKWEHEFARLRRAMWDGYRGAMPTPGLPSADEVHLCFSLSEALYWETQARTGELDAWGRRRRSAVRDSLGPATESAAAALSNRPRP